MRSEKEMLSLIEEIALEDENIRAAYLEGSRVNPNVTKDLFQDYDVVYIVETTRPYRENKEWITRFGEILYMNYPEDNVHYPSDVENCYGWQIQCGDGNRLDLHVCTRDYALERLEMNRFQRKTANLVLTRVLAQLHGLLSLLLQKPEIVVCLPEHMVCQQRKNDGANLASGYSLCPRCLKITVLLCRFQCFPRQSVHGSAILLPCLLQKSLIITGKGICRFDQFAFRRIKQAADKQRMFHHDLIPEPLCLSHLFHRFAGSILQGSNHLLI